MHPYRESAEKALYYCKLAAEGNDTEALWILGFYSYHGTELFHNVMIQSGEPFKMGNLPQNRTKAREYWKQAADLGHSAAKQALINYSFLGTRYNDYVVSPICEKSNNWCTIL